MRKSLIVGLAMAAAVSLNAQEAQKPGVRGVPPIMKALDANNDRTLSAEEIAGASAALKTLDKNNDGQLSNDELMPQAPGKQQPAGSERPRFMPPFLTALDTNNDGTLSAEEIANASAALKKLDKNNDGKLTNDEIMPGPGRGRGPGGPPRPEKAG